MIHETLTLFKQLSKTQKISLLTALIILLTLTVGIITWSLMPKYAVLFNRLDNQDANRILNQLEHMEIPYKLTQQGSSILVHQDRVDALRLKLMGNDLKLSGGIGFELFDRSDFGMTEFSQKINYQRALQGELERTIASLSEVKSARVHLVMPQKHLFQQDNASSAAVTLHLKPWKKLSPTQVRSIQRLIAASVAKLDEQHIVIVDAQGNSLSRTNQDDLSEHLQQKKLIERYLTEKAMRVLHAVYDDKVMVNIDATLNYDQLEQRSEQYLPAKQPVITHSKESKHLKDEKGKPQINDEMKEQFYQYGQIIKNRKIASGTLRHLSISVVIPNDANAKTQTQLSKLVKNAVGFDAHRGDTISIEAIAKTKQTSPLPSISLVAHEANKQSLKLILSLAGLSFLLIIAYSLHYRSTRRRNLLLQQLLALLEQSHVPPN